MKTSATSTFTQLGKMSKLAENAVVVQFRGKNVFDGSHASPHNLYSLQKKNPTKVSLLSTQSGKKDSSWL